MLFNKKKLDKEKKTKEKEEEKNTEFLTSSLPKQ